jgi:crotonobetainyl-CoA:carnitine CoA-transferase CaiB-like acyl-CoA transferase
LNNEGDRLTALLFVSEADIVISNIKPSSARRMGIDSDTLCAENPRLIFAQLNSYPDPEDERPAFDAILQAEAGFMYMNGEPDREPVKMPVALIDILAAHQAERGCAAGTAEAGENRRWISGNYLTDGIGCQPHWPIRRATT